MKALLIGIVLSIAVVLPTQAVTWYQNGMVFGNVCRAGIYYTIYEVQFGQPVGSVCPVRDQFGMIIAWGYVTSE